MNILLHKLLTNTNNNTASFSQAQSLEKLTFCLRTHDVHKCWLGQKHESGAIANDSQTNSPNTTEQWFSDHYYINGSVRPVREWSIAIGGCARMR